MIFPQKSLAASCDDYIMGNSTFEITESCSFTGWTDANDSGRTVAGLDSGTGTTNTSILTVSSGILAITSIETIAVGDIIVSDTGSITVATGATIITDGTLWAIDADDDHCPASDEFYVATSSPHADAVRLNTITDFITQDCEDDNASVQGGGTAYYQDSDDDGYGNSDESTSTCGSAPEGYVADGTDCNDTGTNSENVHVSATCYLDSDGDTYGDSSTSYTCTDNAICTSVTWASQGDGSTASNTGSLAANNTDCYDSNANAFPGQTTCYTSHRGDGSFDYNCDSSSTGCNSCPLGCNSGAWVWTKGCTTYCLNASNKQVLTNKAQAGCGISGGYAGNSKKTSCSCCPCNLGSPKNISCYSCTRSCK